MVENVVAVHTASVAEVEKDNNASSDVVKKNAEEARHAFHISK